MDIINIGIDKETRALVIEGLNKLLSDQYILFVKLKKYHWNAKGHHFRELHLLFDSHYEIMDIVIDDTAEIIRQLGGEALGSMKGFLDNTSLVEDNGKAPDVNRMSANLTADHEALIREMRDLVESKEIQAICEVEDFLSTTIHTQSKMAWMTRMYNMDQGH